MSRLLLALMMSAATTALRALPRSRVMTPRRAAMTMKEGATTVVVTGASRGIGAAIAKDLGAQGCNVVVNYAASEGPALEVVEAIKASGGDAIAIKANMAELDDIKAMFKQVASEFGGCDVLVNNAGITKDGLAMRMKPTQWQDVIDVNLSGSSTAPNKPSTRWRRNARAASSTCRPWSGCSATRARRTTRPQKVECAV